MSLDNKTLFIALIFVLSMTSFFSLVNSIQKKEKGYVAWFSGNILMLLGFILILFQATLPWIFSIIAANLFIILGYILGVRASVYLCENKKVYLPIWFYPVAILFFLFSFPYFTYATFDTEQRIIFFNLIIIFISATAIVYLYKNTIAVKNIFFSKYAFPILYITSGLTALIRTGSILFSDSTLFSIYSINWATSFHLMFFIFFQISHTMLIFSVSLQKANNMLEHEKMRLENIFSFLHLTASELDLAVLYRKIEEILINTFNVDIMGIYLQDTNKETHSLVQHYGLSNDVAKKALVLGPGKGISGKAIEEKKIIIVDIEEYPDKDFLPALKGTNIEYLSSVPIPVKGEIVGAISIGFYNRRNNRSLDKEMLLTLSEQLGLVISNARHFQQVKNLANIDPLTGLANRRQIRVWAEKEVERFKRYNKKFSIGIMDIDHFKRFNDTLGHDGGDFVLSEVSKTLYDVCRKTDHVSRWGGEEFLLIFTETDLAGAAAITEKIRKDIESLNFDYQNHDIKITVSIGVSEFDGTVSLDQCIEKADKNMYRAKKTGRNAVIYG